MPQVTLPNVRDGMTSEQKILYLTDTYYKLKKELYSFSKTLTAITSLKLSLLLLIGFMKVKANQLVIGGENGSISFEDLSDKPSIPVLPSYIKSTYIDSATVQSPTITGGTLTGGVIRTSLLGNERLELSGNGFIGYNPNNNKNGISVETGTYGFFCNTFLSK